MGGKSIRIYLSDGTGTGLRHIEVFNWTGQGLLCPRSHIAELADWKEVLAKPGVYFLIGPEGEEHREVYIGESENVHSRLKSHVKNKDFWQTAIAFTNKDENITKAHVKYLESRLCTLAMQANRYQLTNPQQNPTQSRLPRAEVDAMEEFIDLMRVALSALSHRLLEPLVKHDESRESGTVGPLICKIKGAVATGVPTAEGFVVLQGSTALKRAAPQMNPGARKRKLQLIESGELEDIGELLRFVRDTLLTSPNQASNIVHGNAVNARKAWKDESGRTLAEMEADLLKE